MVWTHTLDEETPENLQYYVDKCYHQLVVGNTTKTPTPSSKRSRSENFSSAASSPERDYEEILDSVGGGWLGGWVVVAGEGPTQRALLESL